MIEKRCETWRSKRMNSIMYLKQFLWWSLDYLQLSINAVQLSESTPNEWNLRKRKHAHQHLRCIRLLFCLSTDIVHNLLRLLRPLLCARSLQHLYSRTSSSQRHLQDFTTMFDSCSTRGVRPRKYTIVRGSRSWGTQQGDADASGFILL